MTRIWIKAALVRAIRTIAQAAVSLISVGAVMSDIDWPMVASASLLAGILSLLTSVAGLPEVEMEQKAQDNEACYAKMAQEANKLREELYPEEDEREESENA